MNDYLGWRSFRELDQTSGMAKGSAFKVFKRIEQGLEESHDYVLLRLQDQRDLIETLRSSQRIYASSMNVVLLSPATERLILNQLQKDSSEP